MSRIDFDKDKVEATYPLSEQEHRVEQAGKHRLRRMRSIDGEADEFADLAALGAERVGLGTKKEVSSESSRRIEANADGSGKRAFIVRGKSADVVVHECCRCQIAPALIALPHQRDRFAPRLRYSRETNLEGAGLVPGVVPKGPPFVDAQILETERNVAVNGPSGAVRRQPGERVLDPWREPRPSHGFPVADPLDKLAQPLLHVMRSYSIRTSPGRAALVGILPVWCRSMVRSRLSSNERSRLEHGRLSCPRCGDALDPDADRCELCGVDVNRSDPLSDIGASAS